MEVLYTRDGNKGALGSFGTHGFWWASELRPIPQLLVRRPVTSQGRTAASGIRDENKGLLGSFGTHGFWWGVGRRGPRVESGLSIQTFKELIGSPPNRTTPESDETQMKGKLIDEAARLREAAP